MFLHIFHTQMICSQNEENCAFLGLMLERMFPYKYCTDDAFPLCVLHCVYLGHLMLRKSTGILYIGMVYTSNKREGEPGFSYLLERMSSHNLCTGEAFLLCARVYVYSSYLL